MLARALLQFEQSASRNMITRSIHSHDVYHLFKKKSSGIFVCCVIFQSEFDFEEKLPKQKKISANVSVRYADPRQR